MLSPKLAFLGLGAALAACKSPPGGGPVAVDAVPDVVSECPNFCSGDARYVTDCRSNPIEACDAESACYAGACVPACDAAANEKSSIGCDYYAVPPDVIVAGRGGCFAAFIANTWPAPVTITVERDGVALPLSELARVPSGQGQSLTYAPLVNDELPPGEVAILFLSRFGSTLVNCPDGVTPAVVTSDTAVVNTGRGHAFRIRTSAPTVAYDIFPYGGGSSQATSATLLLPTSAWDVTYVAVTPYPRSTISGGAPFAQIAALHDATTVTVRPIVDIVGGVGVEGAVAGTPVSYTLDAGEYLQLTQQEELAGSPITADKPVGVWGGASCLNIEVAVAACDTAHQQIPHVQALGNRYAGVRYRNRFPDVEETVPWRLIGTTDGTTLTYSPAVPPGAPTTLALGQVATFTTSEPFVVQSQDADHPFYMAGYMTGAETVRGQTSDFRGDPEFVNVIAVEQYLRSYTFFTDPTYPETTLVLTRERASNGTFADVTIDCVGTVTGWTSIDAAGTLQFARVDLVTGNFQSVGGCDNGRHVASSLRPFGLVVWGWGSAATTNFSTQAVSYAYPAGASVKQINDVVIY